MLFSLAFTVKHDVFSKNPLRESINSLLNYITVCRTAKATMVFQKKFLSGMNKNKLVVKMSVVKCLKKWQE